MELAGDLSGAELCSPPHPIEVANLPAPVTIRDACAKTLAMLDARREGTTLCPSEVARALAAADGDWRRVMPAVHAAVDELLDRGSIRLSWKGRMLAKRAGPYRVAR